MRLNTKRWLVCVNIEIAVKMKNPLVCSMILINYGGEIYYIFMGGYIKVNGGVNWIRETQPISSIYTKVPYTYVVSLSNLN